MSSELVAPQVPNAYEVPGSALDAASESPSPSIGDGSPTLGSLSREVIRRVIRERIGDVRTCYEIGLNRDPALEGRVMTSFIIAGTGRVQSATVTESTLDDPGVESCIVGVVRSLVFPPPDGGGVVGVNYPFVLTSTE